MLPFSSSAFARSFRESSAIRLSSISLRLPASTTRPSTVARAPCPGMASKLETGLSASPSAFAFSITACAKGCSLDCSREATSRSRSLSETGFPSATISTTWGCPTVSVPVLSKMIACRRPASSRAVASLKRTPFSAPLPLATIIAMGVASPSASGQAITTTVIASIIAKTSVAPATQYQIPNVAKPMTMAEMVNTWAAISATRCEGAFEFWADCTSLTT